jgi:methionine-rich copper-binding protein CopC
MALITLLPGQQASAHANLVGCSLHAHYRYLANALPHSIRAQFAEELDPRGSWRAVFEAAGDHGKVQGQPRARIPYTDPKTMVLRLPHLRPGAYVLLWYTHSAIDGDVPAGVIPFTVRHP